MPGPALVEPTPTRLEPAGASQIQVVWNNRSDQQYVLSITGQRVEQQAFAAVEPCSIDGVSQFVDTPFEVGLGRTNGFVAEPMPTIVRSSELEAREGRYAVMVNIAADGTVSAEPLSGPWEPRRGDC